MTGSRTLIVYHSSHHGNTEKVVRALAEQFSDIDLMTVEEARNANLSAYARIGLASGIYMGSFAKPLIRFAEECIPSGKPVFTIYTYGIKRDGYTSAIHTVLRGKKCRMLGSCGCAGYDTFGPFGLIGGISKGHPSPTDIRQMSSFYEYLKY